MPAEHLGIQRLQARDHLLRVDELPIPIDLHHTGPAWGDIERRRTGLALLYQQGVRVPQHDPQHGRGSAAKQGGLTHQTLGIGREVAQPVEAPLSLTLGIKLLHMVLRRLPVAGLAHFRLQQRGPLAYAALGHQVVTATALLPFPLGQVQLVAQQGAIAAGCGQTVIAAK